MIYPWQFDDWKRFEALRGEWPHAVLLEGPAGIGKAVFAQHLAQAILCEAQALQGHPCGACEACLWMAQGYHPDYRLLVPEHLQVALEPVSSDSEKKTSAPSQEIKIASVRDLHNICTVTAYRGGWRVVLLYPAEALNIQAANALLKMLEEPAEKVIFILLSARLDRVLPTITSRCRRYTMKMPTAVQALAWLETQGIAHHQAQSVLAWAGGAPLAALAHAQKIEEGAASAPWKVFVEQLSAGKHCDILACAQALQKMPAEVFISMLQRWLYDLGALRLARRVQYFPDHIDALTVCAARLNVPRWAQYVRAIYAQRAVEHHPLNARLRVEDAMVSYTTIFM